MTYRLSRDATRDFDELVTFIGADNPAAAEAIRAKIVDALERLAADELPARRESLPGLKRAAWSWPVPPYRIFFGRRAFGIFVYRIYHGARRPIAR